MGAGLTLTGSALIKANNLQASLNRTSQLMEMPNKDGEASGLVFWNELGDLDLRVYPSDTTLAAAITAGGTLGLHPGDKLVVASTDDIDLAQNWIVIKVGKTRKVSDKVEFDMSVRKWPTDLSTTTV